MVTNNSKNQPTGATGKVMQGQGVGTAANFSTATYPSTATGTGKILRADGTNWVASTATYPDMAGTSGNVLTSDGTNWVSSAAGGGAFLKGYLTTGLSGSTPADSTTYYFSQSMLFNSITSSSSTLVRIYVPTAFTLNKVVANFRCTGTLGSSQNATFFIRKNNSSNTNISTTVQITAEENGVTNNSVGLSFAAGDFFAFGFTGPAWTTNPTLVNISISWSS